jgi:sugar-specific transcriptional regulator TrmB
MPERYGITVDVLTELGLTQNQAKVYLSVAKIGPATISDVADDSGVRREEVYRLLPDLEKIGLVERLMGKPMRIRSPDVESAMSSLIRRERNRARERISALTERTNVIEEYLSKTGLNVSPESSEQDDFALLEEKESVRTRLHEMIMEAKEKVDVIYSRENLVWFLSTQSQLLVNATSRGVKVRLLSNPTTGRDRIPKIITRRFSDSSAIELKYMTAIPTNYIAVDGKEAMIVTSPTHQPAAHNLYTTNASLLSLVHRVFELSWSQSSHWKTLEGIVISEMTPMESETLGRPRDALFIYTTEKHKESTVLNFIRQGLKQNSFVLYICPQSKSKKVNECLASSGSDMIARLSEDAIRIVPAGEFLFTEGKFNIDKAIDTWDEVYFHATDRGFEGLLAVIDMQVFFDKKMTDQIVTFEKELHKILDEHMSVMCVYNETSFLEAKDPIELFKSVVLLHHKLLSEDVK